MRRLFIGLAVVLVALALLAALVLPPGMLGNLRDGAVIVWNGPRHPPSEVRVYKQTPTRPLEINIFLPEPGTAPGATVVLFHGGGFHSGWSVEHPLVRTHPETGRRSLFLAANSTTRIAGLSEPESDLLLGFLLNHIQSPEFHCRFRWRRHSIAFWDQRCILHYAVPDYREQRTMYRISIDGDKPR